VTSLLQQLCIEVDAGLGPVFTLLAALQQKFSRPLLDLVGRREDVSDGLEGSLAHECCLSVTLVCCRRLWLRLLASRGSALRLFLVVERHLPRLVVRVGLVIRGVELLAMIVTSKRSWSSAQQAHCA